MTAPELRRMRIASAMVSVPASRRGVAGRLSCPSIADRDSATCPCAGSPVLRKENVKQVVASCLCGRTAFERVPAQVAPALRWDRGRPVTVSADVHRAPATRERASRIESIVQVADLLRCRPVRPARHFALPPTRSVGLRRSRTRGAAARHPKNTAAGDVCLRCPVPRGQRRRRRCPSQGRLPRRET